MLMTEGSPYVPERSSPAASDSMLRATTAPRTANTDISRTPAFIVAEFMIFTCGSNHGFSRRSSGHHRVQYSQMVSKGWTYEYHGFLVFRKRCVIKRTFFDSHSFPSFLYILRTTLFFDNYVASVTSSVECGSSPSSLANFINVFREIPSNCCANL